MPSTKKTLLDIHQASLLLPHADRNAFALREHAKLFATLKGGSERLSTLAVGTPHVTFAAGLVSAPNLADPKPSSISARRK
jgi:hypothetical protein